MSVKPRVHRTLHSIGVDVVRYDGRHFPARRRAEILDALTVDLVLDVGANEGHSAETSGERDTGERSRRSSPSATPSSVSPTDATPPGRPTGSRWAPLPAPLLHRAENSWSSSLLPITAQHVEASPDATYVGTEEVDVRTLDSYGFEGRVYLKIDAQGFETPILQGARETLDRSVVALELELSTTALYEGQALMGDVLNDLHTARLLRPVAGAVLRTSRDAGDPPVGRHLRQAAPERRRLALVGQVPRNLVAELQSRLELRRAVETGTWRGEGARRLAAVFPEVMTVELSSDLHADARYALAASPHVRVLHGPSPEVLAEVVDGDADPLLAGCPLEPWRHGRLGRPVPAARGVTAIAGGCTRDDCVLIDDADYFLATPAGSFDPAQWPSIWQVFEALRSVWPDHHVSVAHDIVVAVPPQARDIADHFAHESIGHYWPLHRRARRRVLAQMLTRLEREGQ